MQNKINKEVVCILADQNESSTIEIRYVEILNPLINSLQTLRSMCDDGNTHLVEILRYLKTNSDFDKLNGTYKYCESLRGSYQGFSVNNQEEISKLISSAKLLEFSYKNNPKGFDLKGEVESLKSSIVKQYSLWCHAHSINKIYRQCHDDAKVLTFSHRICGWSNPLYQLTPNFSVEIMTNFGYGPVSYFYTKFKYKNIEITPVSDWITYEKAAFAEIIRYSKKHDLEHERWLEAMEYAKEACNLSRTSEEKFVSKYIIDECEKMVNGLEHVIANSQFQFRNHQQKEYTVDKNGHVLIEFRGEKVSGALDFINKIMEFKDITSVNVFIEKIKTCNRKIQPVLANEVSVLDLKIPKLEAEIIVYKPKHDKIYQEHQEYGAKREELKVELINKNLMSWKSINKELWEEAFTKKYPDFEKFEIEFNKVRSNWLMMNENLKNLKICRNKIAEYNGRILSFFK